MKRIFILAFVLAILFSAECFAEFREVKFGRYYLNADSKELLPVEWIVLDENDDATLLMTKKCIDELPFSECIENVTWKNCTLRNWLNDKFFSTAFTPEEQDAIIMSGLPDKVFVLNRSEVIKYLHDEKDRQCVSTDYSRLHGTYTNENGLCAWWTRSLSENNSLAVYLSSYGTFGNRPHYVDDNVIGVRPALWVKKNFLAAEAEKFLYSFSIISAHQ